MHGQPPQGGALALRRPGGALQTEVWQRGAPEAEAADDEIDLKAIWRTLVKHRWTIAGVTGLSLLAAVVYTLRATPQYESTVMLQIDRSAQKVVGFNTEVEVDQGPASDQLQLRTQVELLKSRALAERVIDELGLYKRAADGQDPLAAAAAKADSEAALPGADGAAPAEPPGFFATLGHNLSQLFTPSVDDEAVLTRAETLKEFEKAVTIEPVRNSRLVEVRVLNSDAELSARIANTMARAFIASNLERKVDSSVYARQFLEDQIKQTKAKLEESERVINEYAKKNEILNLGDKGSATTQTFVDFSAALAKAEQDRIKAESLYNQLKDNPQNAPQALENLAIQRYKEEKAKFEAEYAKNLATFKPEFPAMVQLRAQIDELAARIKFEENTILGSIKAEYEAAKRQEDNLRAKVASTRSEVLAVQDRSVDMNLLKRELDTNRQVYDSLLQRLKEVSVTAGITTNNVSIVDEASVPLFPAKPKPLINLALGLVLGMFLGMLAALLREQMDDSVKHADEIEPMLGLPLLGLIPQVKPEKGMEESVAMLAHLEPRSAFAEAYRSMRTALQFSTADGAPKRFMVTSCGKGEGKSTTSLALAINFAQLGQRVLLIDADMRKPSIHKALRMPNERGLANLLTGDMPGNETLIRETVVQNLMVLTAGPTPPDPVELLMGPKFGKLLEKAAEMGFSQVVIDGPPLLGIADAIVLGNQIQHMVFSVKASGTKKASIKDAMRRMRNAGLAPMGVVLTQARNEHTADYAYEAYYGYGNEPQGRPALAASGAHTARAATPGASPGKAEGPVGATAGAAGPQTGPADKLTGAWHAAAPAAATGQRHIAWVAGGGAAAVAMVLLLGWWLRPAAPEAPTHAVVSGVVAQPPAAATPATDAAPATAAATAAAPAAAAEPAPAADATATPATTPGPVPALASLKSGPADTWPMLSRLWGVSFDPAKACDNALATGLQCLRMPEATMGHLRAFDRPALVRLSRDGAEAWVMLRALDERTATLVSGEQTWQLPLEEFERQWSNGYSTLWRLPPGHQGRLSTASGQDAAGQWLDAQIRALQAANRLPATEDSFEARVRMVQSYYKLPGNGLATPSVFALINRLSGLDEPRLSSSGG